MRKEKKSSARKFLLLGVCIFMSIIILAIYQTNLLRKQKTPKSELEKQFGEYVTHYYETNIKGKVIGIDRQIVTLERLKQNEYDTTMLEKSGLKQDSFAYVILEDSNETDPSKIKYTIEYHLEYYEEP